MSELIKIIDDNVDVIVQELRDIFSTLTGRVISDSDPEMSLLYSFAYRTAKDRSDTNHAFRQTLLRYSEGSALEEKGYPFDVYRLEPAKAVTEFEYTLTVGHPGVLIPKGNRVKTEDGKFVFQTIEDTNVSAGVTAVQIGAECLQSGKGANDYAIGKINVILDPLAYLESVENIAISEGGSDEETDEELRERIRLASSKFSVAGPDDAYIFFAKSAHPDIVDVQIDNNDQSGEVHIYVLLKDGGLPGQSILDLVETVCTPKKVRPMNDIVSVHAPTQLDFSIDFDIILRKEADPATLTNAIARVNAFVEARKEKLGVDVKREQIKGVVMSDLDNIYDIILKAPTADIVASKSQYTNCLSVIGFVKAIADE